MGDCAANFGAGTSFLKNKNYGIYGIKFKQKLKIKNNFSTSFDIWFFAPIMAITRFLWNMLLIYNCEKIMKYLWKKCEKSFAKKIIIYYTFNVINQGEQNLKQNLVG